MSGTDSGRTDTQPAGERSPDSPYQSRRFRPGGQVQPAAYAPDAVNSAGQRRAADNRSPIDRSYTAPSHHAGTQQPAQTFRQGNGSGTETSIERLSSNGEPPIQGIEHAASSVEDSRDHMFLRQPPEQSQQATGSIWERLNPTRDITMRNVRLAGTWLAGAGDDLGMIDYDLMGTIMFARLPSLTVSPGFQALYLNGPSRTDLPPRLYNARVEFRWMQQIARPFALELVAAPRYWSDLQRSDSNAVQLFGQAVGIFATSVQTQWVLGIMHLDRDDFNWLPVAGVIHQPSADVRLELVFPRPKAAVRVSGGQQSQRWAYLMGEFGGGSWAIVRTGGASDVVTYSDWRLILGVEQKFNNGRSLFFEAGYVFSRSVSYRRGRGDYDPDSTAMLRAGLVY